MILLQILVARSCLGFVPCDRFELQTEAKRVVVVVDRVRVGFDFRLDWNVGWD